MGQALTRHRIPWWKSLLSYITELHVESTSSPYNPHLYVSIRKGRYMLSTKNAIYSYSDKYDNFGNAFKKMELQKIDSVLILGFGLGSIPYILEKVHGLRLNYVGVEIDEEIIYLASKYIIPELESDIELIRADASVFIQQDSKRYDLITMDVFESDYIPARFESEEFLHSLKGMLTEDGMLMYNRLAYTEEDIRKTVLFMENTFAKVFPEYSDVHIKGNIMLTSKPIK